MRKLTNRASRFLMAGLFVVMGAGCSMTIDIHGHRPCHHECSTCASPCAAPCETPCSEPCEPCGEPCEPGTTTAPSNGGS